MEKCEKGLHFPEHMYYWDFLEKYCAHCAVCSTDYTVECAAVLNVIPGQGELPKMTFEVKLYEGR